MPGYYKDLAGGLLMIGIGLAAALQGSIYGIGTLHQVGPGFFPASLGVILILVGVVIGAGALLTAWPNNTKMQIVSTSRYQPEWRGWLCIAVAIEAFAILGKYGGLLPATFAITFISALGDRDNNIRNALILACSVMIVCVMVFWWALNMQFSLIRWG